MSSEKKKVCVIGAGVCGLTCIKTFIESGFEVVCYEKSPHFGGLWHYNTTSDVDGDNFHPSIMRTTILNTSKELSSFSDFPPPPKLPNFMNHSLYMDYIKSYVKHFNISPHLRLRHEVLRCKQDCEPESGQIFWELEVRNLETGELSKKRFDKLVVASGHHNSPFMPTLSGQDKFKGLIIHSMYVKDILTDERFKGKNVLVIGIGNSACDAANDLALVANRCYLSCHRGTWFLSRLTNEGLYDFRLNNRWAQWMSRHIPTSMSDRRVIKWAERNMSHKLLGLRPKHKPTELVPTVNDIFPYRVFTGGVVLKTSVSRFTENGVKFEGDEEEECPVDVVVFATGYKAQTPFLRDLESGIRSSQNSDEYDLFLNIFAPRLSSTEQKANGRDLSSPVESLAFIGYLQPTGSIAVIAELQARLVALVFSGGIKLPSTEKMLKRIQIYRMQRSQAIRSHSKDQLVGDWIGYQDELAKMIGVKPKLGRLFLSDLRLWKRLVFGPSVSYQYRLRGPNNWSGAREAIMNVRARVYQGINEGKNDILYETRSRSLTDGKKKTSISLNAN